MSVASPTVLPRSLLFPNVLPNPPQPYPLPLPARGQRPGRLNSRRDLAREMDDLSDEEDELEGLTLEIKNRGYNFLIPIGRAYTQQEEKNDADEDESADGTDSGEAPSILDEENDSAEDLDAEMDEMDEVGNITAETADIDPDEYPDEELGSESDEDESDVDEPPLSDQ
ncbi:hypothetical protein OBBRIDRAFT_818497 [Obba rivulosa]|uniref:Uncharacterized protein n=1 Tax=Obba rivulosa TaxID=1052685 RepID=A0A8E2B1I3_9APHY|nr:hypothetical protein OBBRIDRAFT_818497 [Obba rivulosa]